MICRSHHQPQQIVNKRPIRSHGTVFGPRPLNLLDFYYTRMVLAYILFVGSPGSHFTSILPKIKDREKKAYCLRKTIAW